MAKESTRFKIGAREIWIVVIVVYLLVAIPAVVFVPVWIVDLGIPHAARIATAICFADPAAAECANAVPATETMAAVSSARQSALLAAGGGLAVITIVLTILRDGITRAQAAHDRETHITSMYVDALNQLSDKEQVAVRIGGVHALKLIATDSARHGEAVMAVLAEFIRVEGVREPKDPDDAFVSGDLEVALQVLGDLRSERNASSGLRLTRLKLRELRLERANFRKSDLLITDAQGAKIIESDFDESDAFQVKFWNSDLTGTSFRKAKLHMTDFSGAKLQGVDFTGAELFKARLHHADLRQAIGLTAEQIETVAGWTDLTRWPDGLTPSEKSRAPELLPKTYIHVHEV